MQYFRWNRHPASVKIILLLSQSQRLNVKVKLNEVLCNRINRVWYYRLKNSPLTPPMLGQWGMTVPSISYPHDWQWDVHHPLMGIHPDTALDYPTPIHRIYFSPFRRLPFFCLNCEFLLGKSFESELNSAFDTLGRRIQNEVTTCLNFLCFSMF